MGSLTSRQNAAVEEADVGSNHAYKYPPRSGNYFGSHFIMGGERFDTPQPEAYLFGENADLNFLGSRPTAFPYPPPQANEPTKTLKSLVNIRKESVRFVKAPDSATKIHGDGTTNKGNSFNIEFVFDSDAKCAITIYYFCTEEVSATGVTYVPRDPSLTSETYHYKKGVNQYFSQNSHIFNPNLFSEDDLSYNPDKDVFPVAIHCIVDEGAEDCRQSHTTICVVDHHTDGTYALRALKQKIFVDGLSYLLQEIYGIENKAINKPATDEDTDDNGSECVICMSDTRDTLILPCRHLCLCNSCADSLRYQANNCPICRAPFRALLQIRAVQKSSNTNVNHVQPQNLSDLSNEHIPPGYAPVSLIEALNGPPQCISRTSHDCGDGVENEGTQNTDTLTKNSEKNSKLNSKDSEKRAKEKSNSTPSEFRMSILLSKENGTAVKDSDKQSPHINRSASISENKNVKEKTHSRQTSRDSVHVINERNNTKLEGTDPDDDSDAEKLSPLLNSSDKKSPASALHIEGVEESIDDTDTDVEDGDCDVERKRIRPALSADGDGIILAGAEDSDYYTPEDPHTTILSPLCPEKINQSECVFVGKFNENSHKSKGGEKTIPKDPVTALSPVAPIKENIAASLPDSPISGNSTSTGSSSDSYSSSSSTKQLLSSSQTNSSSKLLEEKSNNLDGPLAV